MKRHEGGVLGWGVAWLVFVLPVLWTEAAAAEPEIRPGVFQPLPLGAVKPEGWLHRQLEVQREGLTGHLDLFWPDVQHSGWIGGQAEGWERMPYWMDGAVPLAWLLDDPDLIARLRRYVDYVLSHQASDDWLGPERSPEGKYQPRDPWPVFVFLKALTQYAEASGDQRVVPAMSRFFRRLDAELEARPLFEWNRMRWQDGVLSIYWLYERTGDPALPALAQRLQRQGYDWLEHFRKLPHREKVTRWEHESHVVNNAMGVKTAAVLRRLTGESRLGDEVWQAVQVLDRYHGQASGVFSGDECFAGRMPSQGTETCAVVEYMYSLETAVAVTGDPRLADRLERITFNALPAAVKADWWGRQYVQQANQPVVRISPDRIYTTNGEKANLYGLETNYGCCTANMHQGWPKFVAHLWMRSGEGGLVAAAYGPSRVAAEVAGSRVQVRETTDYPFSDRIEFLVSVDQPVEFPLHLRVPEWCPRAVVQVGEEAPQELSGKGYQPLRRRWSGTTRIQLKLDMPLRTEPGYGGTVRVWQGPVLYSLRVPERWRWVGGRLPAADWEVLPEGPWNYALELDPAAPERGLEKVSAATGCVFCPGGPLPGLLVWARRLPGWSLEHNAAAPPPPSPVRSLEPRERVVLAPYGAVKLRMTDLPLLAPVEWGDWRQESGDRSQETGVGSREAGEGRQERGGRRGETGEGRQERGDGGP